MARIVVRVLRLGMVAVLAAAGSVAIAAQASAGGVPKKAAKPFVRQWGAKPPPPGSVGRTQFPQPSVQYWGGPVLRTNETFVIFWDPAGQLSQSYRDLVVRYFHDVAADHGDDVYAVLNQYYDTTGPITNSSSYAGSAVDTNPFPAGCPAVADYATCFNDQQLKDELDQFLDAQGITRPANRGFFVFTPPGINDCFDAAGQLCATNRFCGYHGNAHGGHGDFLYAVLPFAARRFCELDGHPNGSDADPAINIASHEHREMIDDPYVADATAYAPPLAWADPNTGDETSDKCAFYYGPTKTNGVGPDNAVINSHQYLLQTEWSNALAADDGLGCVQNGSDRPPVAAFSTSLSGPTLTASAAGSSDPDPGDSVGGLPAFWQFGDNTGGSGTGTIVKHRYASPGTYAVSVTVTDQFGASDIEMHTVKVTNPRPAPSHSFTAKFDINLESSLFGYGNATGMGAAGTESFGLDVDGTDFPNSVTFFVPSDFVVRLSNTDDQIYADLTLKLTDVASPPAGNNYTVDGGYVFQGGQGRYFDTSGSGRITGTCTSSFDRNDADCALDWKGTIAGD